MRGLVISGHIKYAQCDSRVQRISQTLLETVITDPERYAEHDCLRNHYVIEQAAVTLIVMESDVVQAEYEDR